MEFVKRNVDGSQKSGDRSQKLNHYALKVHRFKTE